MKKQNKKINKKQGSGLSKKTKKIIGIIVSILVGALVFTTLMLFPKGSGSFTSIINIGDTISNEDLSLSVTNIVVTDTLGEVTAKEGNTFVCVSYEYYMTGFVNDGSQDLNLETDIDTTQPESSDENTQGSEGGTQSEVNELTWEYLPFLTLGKYATDEVETLPESSYSNSNVNEDALREYSHITGVDLSVVLNPLAEGEIRSDCEVFEISKDDLTNFKLFITFDIFSEGIEVKEGLGELPTLEDPQ